MKAYTDESQSKELSEILPPESADMYYHCCYDGTYNLSLPTNGEFKNKQFFKEHPDEIPCWSLAALINCLPLEVSINKQADGVDTYCYITSYDSRYRDIDTQLHTNPVDACVEMIIKLHELNIL